MRIALRRLASCIAIVLACQACADMGAPPPRDVRSRARQLEPGAPVSTAELQQWLERFTGQFLDELAQAAEVFDDPKRPARQTIALRRVMLYGSSALDIATGPLPEVNVLDMLVFL